ncbi:formimidoylglutamate deiminase [Sneathiella sp.]|uniref:formimidoylglutamate deiminase n=1 Tax=Sneathiella sp. TaxID=1964365 RepID=UPI0035649D8B
MRGFHFEQVLLEDGWATDVSMEVDPAGHIISIEKSAQYNNFPRIRGAAVPGMPNLHSHAFQRAMAGLAERRSSPTDSFWSWRKIMYGFLDLLEPEDVTAITAQLYAELLTGGYTSVAEFHYLHHDRDGLPYETPSRMSEAIIEGARQAGMPLTLLPVFYAHSGFGGQAPEQGQRRFINSLDSYQEIHAAAEKMATEEPLLSVGVAPHSLRAATKDELDQLTRINPATPLHIHIAEQQKEISDCEAAYGARPLDWLYDNFNVDDRWCLVHATHVTDDELARIVTSRTIVGLCPLTEANLGDGVFPAKAFVDQGGMFGIGSDSNVCLSAARELESLEYGQRLFLQERNVISSKSQPDTGRYLYEKALAGGAQALNQPVGALRVGARADFIVLDMDHPDLYGRPREHILDILLFASDRLERDVFVAGHPVVSKGQHIHRDTISTTYKNRMKNLLSRL